MSHPPVESTNARNSTPGWTASALSSGQAAGWPARLGARIVDWAIVGGIGAAVAADAVATSSVGGPEILILVPLVGIVYEVPLTAVRGQTLGKTALRIRVIRLDDGLVPGWGKSLGRTAVPMAAALIPLAGWIGALLVYASVLWGDHRQGWHDKAARTMVVMVEHPESGVR